MKIVFSFLVSVLFLISLNPIQARAADDTTYIQPVLSVNIPTVSFSAILDKGGYIEVNWLAEYITGIYKYLLGFSAIFAILLIMVGGLQYVASPGGSGASAGKKRITNAVTGLVLLFSAFLILFTVNPKLTAFKSLGITVIDPEVYVLGYDNYDSGGSVSGSAPLTSAGIICPKNTTSSTLRQIAESFNGHVAYRWGGKGGPPPYPETNSKYNSTCDSTGQHTCKDYCPEGNMCFDCSGFANYVRYCAGLPQGPYPTFNSNSEKISSCDLNSNSVNGVALKPGDFVGWGRGDRPKEPGSAHIMIYIGDGLVADSHGSGRAPGMGVKTDYPLASICNKAKSLTYRILRVP